MSTDFAIAGDFVQQDGLTYAEYVSGTIAGQLLLQGGTFELNNLYSLTVTGGVAVEANGTLSLVGGNLVADVVNGGKVTMNLLTSIPTTAYYSIEGDYTQISTGLLVFHLSSSLASGFLSVRGHATFAGTLQIVPTPDFEPMTRAQLLIEYPSYSGAFGSVLLPPAGDGQWSYTYDHEDPRFDNAFVLFYEETD